MIINDYFKAAHEVKNTISLACANLDLLESDENNSANIRKYRLIKNELLRMHDLMLDVLRFVKEDPVSKVKINPREIIREVVYKYYESMHYSFNFNFDAPLHEVFVNGDRAKLRQVFTNIIKNSLDSGTNSRRLTLFIQIEVENRFVKITIRDNGVGFQLHDPEPAYVNENMEQSTEELTEFSKYGLGLLITKCIIAEHGGLFELHSENGVGTTVCIRLPMHV